MIRRQIQVRCRHAVGMPSGLTGTVTLTAAVLAVLTLIASACSTNTDVRTSADVTDVPSLSLLGVISGSGDGWVYGATDRESASLYHWTTEGLERETTLPVFTTPILTTLGDTMFVGGVRCSNSECDGWSAEVMRVNRSGQVLGTTVLDEGSTPPDDTTGISLVGRNSDQLTILTNSGLSGIDSEGGRHDLAQGSPPGGVCAIGDAVFAVTFPDQRVGQAVVMPAAGSMTILRASIMQLADGKWDAAQQGDISVDLPAPSTVTCGADSVAIRSGDIIYGMWTPERGIEKVTPAAGAPDGAFSPSSTGRTYALAADGKLLERGPKSLDTGLKFDPGDPSAPPPRIFVDDSTGQIFACVSYPPAVGSDGATPTACSASKTKDGAP